MKRTLIFLACVLTSLTMSAQGDLTVGDIQNSGCLSRTRGENEPLPTIILTKEGSFLSVQLLNYESNCATSDFNVTPTVSGGSDGVPYSVNINVVPYLPGDEAMDCICPYNVSFTVRDVEANSFYLSGWWYEGEVTLEEGKPLVLEDIWEEVTIDGMKYTLRKAMGRAMLVDGSTQKGEVRIPSELSYEGKDYTVTSIGKYAFADFMHGPAIDRGRGWQPCSLLCRWCVVQQGEDQAPKLSCRCYTNILYSARERNLDRAACFFL